MKWVAGNNTSEKVIFGILYDETQLSTMFKILSHADGIKKKKARKKNYSWYAQRPFVMQGIGPESV